MKTIYGLENLEKFNQKTVITIGVFDGVHIGHQAIIKKAIAEAKKIKGKSVVITFDPHPLDVLKPKAYPTILTSLPLKLELIKELGVDYALVIKFSKAFANMTAQSFIKDVLVDKLNAKEIIIGKGFRFGKHAKGDVKMLEEFGEKHGFKVEGMSLITNETHKISSTRIRQLLKEGDLAQATKILGHYLRITGKVHPGYGRGILTGFHTANLETSDKASVPKEGVYVGKTKVNSKMWPCVISIGPSPTFNIKKKRIETHILGSFDENLQDREVELIILQRLRDIKTFKSASELASQIKKDILKAKIILKKSQNI